MPGEEDILAVLRNIAVAIPLIGWLLLLSSNTVLNAKPPGAPELRYFPEFQGQSLKFFSLANPNYAVGIHEGKLWEWDGASWHPFSIPFPGSLLNANLVRAFSPTCIWIFYVPEEHHYHTQIRRFNGKQWLSVPAKQPFTITKISFLDSLRFIAGGHWGGIIYFDGKNTHNIPAFPFSEITWLKAFAPDLFVAIIRFEESRTTHSLMEYTGKKWQEVARFLQYPTFLSLVSPDSGFCFFPNDPVLYQLSAGELIPVDSIGKTNRFCCVQIEHNLYIFSEGKLYHWDGELHTLAHLNLEGRISTTNGKDFFIRSKNGLYYWGSRKIGVSVPKFCYPTFFFRSLTHVTSYSGHLGLGLYQNQKGDKGNIDVYFTHPLQENAFISVFWGNSIKITNQYKQRKLWGIWQEGKKKEWDGTTYFVDLDNDGDADAFSAALRGRSRIYENIGEDRFRDVTEEAGFHLSGRIAQVCWMDIDNDGWLDFWAGDETDTLRVFKNRKFFRFENITSRMKLPPHLRGALPSASDIDIDGDLDVVLYAMSSPVQILRNDGLNSQTGLPVFVDVSAESPQLTTPFDFFVQSVAFGDYDNDGDSDLFLANRVSPCKLFRNDGQGRFQDVRAEVGVERSFLAYGANWADLDQDGDLDLFLSTLGRNYIFWNQSGLSFKQDSLCLTENKSTYTTASAPADVDGDGDLDLVVANQFKGYSGVWLNQLNRTNSITIELKGKHRHTMGLGGQVWLYQQTADNLPGKLRGYREITIDAGYHGSGLPQANFGVIPGEHYIARVKFPSGHLAQYTALKPGKTYVFFDDTKVSLFKQSSTWLASIVYRSRRRELAFRIASYVMLLGLALFIILRQFSWTKTGVVMFVVTFSSVYILACIPVYGNLKIAALLFPIYLGIFSGGGLILLFQQIAISDFGHEAKQELFSIMQEFYHSRTGMNQLEHLIFYCNNLTEASRKDIWAQDFLQELTKFRNYTLPFIYKAYRQCTYLRQVPISPGKARQRLKTLERISKSFNPTLSAKQISIRLKNFHRQMKLIVEDIRKIRWYVEKLHSSDLLTVVGEVSSSVPGLQRVSLNNTIGRDSIRVVIPGDELAQVLTNLLRNAMEAMQDHPHPEVNITIRAPESGRIELRLQDKGPGISPEFSTRIFDESFSTKGSTGLGLFHARQIVTRYGGKLEVCSASSGKGAEFRIVLKEFINELSTTPHV